MSTPIWWTTPLTSNQVKQCAFAEEFKRKYADTPIPGSNFFVLTGALIQLLEFSFKEMSPAQRQGVMDAWVEKNGTII